MTEQENLTFDDLIDINVFKTQEGQEAKPEIEIEEKEEVEETEENEVDSPEGQPEIIEQEEELTEEENDLLTKVTDLKSLGVLFLPDDYEVESLEKALEDSEQFRQNLTLNTVFNQIPDVEIPGIGNAKDLFVYLYQHQGTDINNFKANFGVEKFNPNSFDVENSEEDRRKVLNIYYKEKGFPDQKREKLVNKVFEDLEDETEAKEALNELTEIYKAKEGESLKRLEAEKIAKEQEAEQAYYQMADILQKKEVIAGFPLTKEEKPKALNSIYRKINVGGKQVTEFDYRLQNVVLQNPELTIALSGILNTIAQDKTGNFYFDLSKFEKKAKTQATKTVYDTLSRVSSTAKKMTSSRNDATLTNSKGFKWENVVDLD